MQHPADRSPTIESPALLRVLAWIGILGCAALIGGTLVAQVVVPDHDWIEDTISDLAAGRLEIIMDVALYGFAAALFAIALASAHAHRGGKSWSVAVLALAVLAALVIIIGARNEYGDGDSDGIVIHIYLVYALGALFVLAPLCIAQGLAGSHPRARIALIILVIAWTIMAPVFLFAATSIDGLLERILGLIACAMICTMCYVFLQIAGGRRGDRVGT